MFKQFAVAAVLALVASSSFADGPVGAYGGLDVGRSKFEGFDAYKTSVGGFLGYGFNTNFAAEFGYRQLGKFDFYDYGYKATQAHLSVVASFPLNERFDVFGRVGYNKLHGEVKFESNTYNTNTSEGLFGAGVSATLTPKVSARFEVQKPTSHSTNYSVGILYKF